MIKLIYKNSFANYIILMFLASPLINLTLIKNIKLNILNIDIPFFYVLYLFVLTIWLLNNYQLLVESNLTKIVLLYQLYLLFLLATQRKNFYDFAKEFIIIFIVLVFFVEISLKKTSILNSQLFDKTFNFILIFMMIVSTSQIIYMDTETFYFGSCFRFNSYMYHPSSIAFYYLLGLIFQLRKDNIQLASVCMFFLYLSQHRATIILGLFLIFLYTFENKFFKIQKFKKVILLLLLSSILVFLAGLNIRGNNICGIDYDYFNLSYEQSVQSFSRIDSSSLENSSLVYSVEKKNFQITLNIEQRINDFNIFGQTYTIPSEFLNGRGGGWSIFIYEMLSRDLIDNVFGQTKWEYIDLISNFDAHNEILRVIFKNGFLGLLIFSCIYFYLLVYLTEDYKSRITFFLITLAIFSISEFFTYFYTTIIFMLLMNETTKLYNYDR